MFSLFFHLAQLLVCSNVGWVVPSGAEWFEVCLVSFPWWWPFWSGSRELSQVVFDLMKCPIIRTYPWHISSISRAICTPFEDMCQHLIKSAAKLISASFGLMLMRIWVRMCDLSNADVRGVRNFVAGTRESPSPKHLSAKWRPLCSRRVWFFVRFCFSGRWWLMMMGCIN